MCTASSGNGLSWQIDIGSGNSCSWRTISSQGAGPLNNGTYTYKVSADRNYGVLAFNTNSSPTTYHRLVFTFTSDTKGSFTTTSWNSSGTFSITKPTTSNLTVSPETWSPGSAAANTTVTVTSNITWNAPTSNQTWLTVDNITPTNRTGNGSFRINATTNTGTSSRTGTITVTGGGFTRTISVTQAGTTTTSGVTLTPANPSATVNVGVGGAGRVAVTVSGGSASVRSSNSIPSGGDPSLFTNTTSGLSGRIIVADDAAGGLHWMHTFTNGQTLFAGTYNDAALTYTVTATFSLSPPANFRSTAQTHNSVTLAWNAVPGATSYKLEQKVGSTWQRIGGTLTVRSYKVTGLAVNTTYSFRVSAVNSAGASQMVSISVKTLPTPPATPGKVTAEATATSVTLTLPKKASNVVEYKITYPDKSVKTKASSLKISSLKPGTSYTFKVFAVTAKGQESLKSSNVTIKTLAAPPPTSVKATALDATRIKITWKAPTKLPAGLTSVTRYEVRNSAGTTIGTVTPKSGTMSYTVKGLKPSKSYSYSVVAVFNGGFKSTEPVTVKATTTK